MEIRQMIAPDLRNGFLEAISALGPTELTYDEAVAVYQRRLRDKILTYVAILEDKIVGTAALIIEQKYLHNGGFVGHIEDVAIAANQQGRGIGAGLVKFLIHECERLGCYKVLLDCTPELMPFYKRAGFQEWVKNMRLDLVIADQPARMFEYDPNVSVQNI
jgi:glucosamine-phosphate N-acetyltransferase